MVSTMKEQDLQDMANKVAGEFQTEPDFEVFMKAWSKQFLESSLEGEMDDHLGYEKPEARGKSTRKKHEEKARVSGTGNSHNGKTSKRIRSKHGELEIDAPHDRNGPFEPKVIAKRQSRTHGIDDKILFL